MRLTFFILLFILTTAFTPRGDNTILLVGDSTLQQNKATTSWGGLVLSDPPKGFRVVPSGLLSGITEPSSGDVTAYIVYGGRNINHWWDSDNLTSENCYARTGGDNDNLGCLNVYRPDIVLLSMSPNDIFKQFIPEASGGWAGGFPDNMEGEYFGFIDYVISCGADVVYVTTFPLAAAEGEFTTTENTTYLTAYDTHIWDVGNYNSRVFFNRLRNHYVGNSHFFFVDLHNDIRTDYPTTTDWTDWCFGPPPGDLHIADADCQSDTWERVKRLISELDNCPIPATAFLQEVYP